MYQADHAIFYKKLKEIMSKQIIQAVDWFAVWLKPDHSYGTPVRIMFWIYEDNEKNPDGLRLPGNGMVTGYMYQKDKSSLERVSLLAPGNIFFHKDDVPEGVTMPKSA